MSEIIYVSPLKFLVNDANWKSEVERSGFVPILKADLYKFEQSLSNAKEKSNGTLNSKDSNSDHRNGVSVGDKIESTKSESSNLSKYMELQQFLPISLEQQLHTLSIQGMPSNATHGQIEHFFVECIKLSKYETALEAWTTLSSYTSGSQNVFIRLSGSSKDTEFANFVIFLEYLSAKFNSLQLHIDSNTRSFVEDNTKINLETIGSDVLSKYNELLRDLQKQKNVNDTSVEDTTQYQVDLNTLSDIPKDSLDQLVKDIIEFRTRVINTEKEKLISENYEENRRIKEKMTKMFERIKRSHLKDQIEERDVDVSFEEEEVNVIDDKLIEQKQNLMAEIESEKRYKSLLKDLATVIEPRMKALQLDIEHATNYETHLVEQRPLFLKEIQNLGNDIYYDRHRTFKEEEERLDKLNREQFGDAMDVVSISTEAVATTGKASESIKNEKTELAAGHIKIKFAFKRAIDKSTEADKEGGLEEKESEEQEGEKEETEPAITSEILSFEDDELRSRISKLRSSKVVDELVKEYLGVYEDELVDYIFDNIEEFKNKKNLLEDLKETFDEDAQKIVDTIWNREELKR
ncbi:hypothetical protein KAFR_0A06570 [Kazachstania africana CBS 2517]|uniref:U1 small nuclear ribonucleoprotein component SNU71 n=1 Tax=Kazachstania africana (strain ATCC 22294 / BCRC 22015 / CBS 2517 / CECT 1963 / NBRC 1671 / NRRL Y-8276) TaxID=1071382 RepID=H2ANZ2_KAZAF|nr:hypothetical protein KAFR_0A06570 [Kazachstania africana CBS 2517]CCF56092.1 hypothetical protein KAFR_0A06570 [Kazachstania africana CBS 2517]